MQRYLGLQLFRHTRGGIAPSVTIYLGSYFEDTMNAILKEASSHVLQGIVGPVDINSG